MTQLGLSWTKNISEISNSANWAFYSVLFYDQTRPYNWSKSIILLSLLSWEGSIWLSWDSVGPKILLRYPTQQTEPFNQCYSMIKHVHITDLNQLFCWVYWAEKSQYDSVETQLDPKYYWDFKLCKLSLLLSVIVWSNTSISQI